MLRNGIEYIYAVYKERSFSHAAEKLFISQPALSTAIQKEESYWHCSFFKRDKIPIELTQEGKYMIEAIEQIKEIQQRVEDHFNQLNSDKAVTLNVGAPAYFCHHDLPRIVKSFKESYPDSNINIIEGSDKDLFAGMRSGSIDCIVTVEKSPSFADTYHLGNESIILAVPRSYAINERLRAYQLTSANLSSGRELKKDSPRVSIREFAEEPFLLLTKGNDMYKRAIQIFSQSGVTPCVRMSLEQLMTSYYMALADIGIAFVRADMMNASTSNLCYYAIDSKYVSRKINLVAKKEKHTSAIRQAFIRHLQENF